MSSIDYKINQLITTQEAIAIFESSGIRRPTYDSTRIQQMLEKADIIVTAWQNEEPIALARSLTDFCYCCYLSDLAVKKEFQNKGIGKKLIELTKSHLGDQVKLILLAAPNAIDYYPKIGLKKYEHTFVIDRKN